MKRLGLFFISIFTLSTLTAASASAVTPTNSWKVDIFTPALTDTKRQINVEYKVLSINAEDSNYTVDLLENNQLKASQTISRQYGNSGVFTVNLPASGTYTYQVKAVNLHAAETKSSSVKTVQIVNGPEPTIVTLPGQATTGQTTGATTNNGTTTGQTNNNGSVTGNAASTTNGTSLGAQTNNNAAKRSIVFYSILGAIVALLITGYALYRRGLLPIKRS